MEFLLNNMELFITGGVVLIVLASVMFGKPLLRKYGFIKEKGLNELEFALFVGKLIAGEIKYNNPENKSRVEKMLNAVDLAIKHIKGLMKTDDKVKLEELSFDTVMKSLAELDIEVDDQEIEAIKIAIKLGIDQMKL